MAQTFDADEFQLMREILKLEEDLAVNSYFKLRLRVLEGAIKEMSDKIESHKTEAEGHRQSILNAERELTDLRSKLRDKLSPIAAPSITEVAAKPKDSLDDLEKRNG